MKDVFFVVKVREIKLLFFKIETKEYLVGFSDYGTALNFIFEQANEGLYRIEEIFVK